jgi:prephenate dehydratase
MQSTAAAAEKVKTDGKGLAISSISALHRNKIPIIAKDIGNKRHGKQNYTDFYIVARENNIPCEKGRDYLTMVAITPKADKIGLLAEILSCVADNGLNNAKIHSRPALDKVKAEEAQMFYLEIAGYAKEKRMENCFSALKNMDGMIVKVLGTYQRPD